MRLFQILVIILTIFFSIFANAKSDSSNSADNYTNPDLIFRLLLGEIASQRGELNLASEIFLDLAKQTNSDILAERATRLTEYTRDSTIALEAAKTWNTLNNESLDAQQALSEILIANNNLDEAMPILQKLLTKEKARVSGFLYLNTMLSRVTDKKSVLNLVSKLAEPYPLLVEAHFAVMHAAWVSKDQKIYEKELVMINKIKPDWETSALFKGQTLAQEKPEKALIFYRDFLSKYPKSNNVQLEYAKILTNERKINEAKNEFIKLVNISNSSAEIILTVGLLSIELEDYDLAEKYFLQSLKKNLKDKDQVFIYLAKIADKKNQYDVAITWLSKVGNGNHLTESKLIKAEIIAKKESVDKALEFLNSFTGNSLDEKLSILKLKSSLFTRSNRHLEAFQLMQNEASNFKESPEFKFDFALLADKLNKYDLMETFLREAIKMKPDYAVAYNALGYSFADRNIKLDDAKKYIEIAMSIAPNNHYILDSMGWLYFRLGKFDAALSYIQKAYDIQADPEIAAHLGEVLWVQGNKKEANDLWQSSLQSFPDNEILQETFKRLN
ncbi:MAG: tetratricopeptide repeat protein [Candidatus Methylopumilus sp.]|nr:tetratricopeptide repeat protein [Candidatus Methylopumilus sp.]